MPEYLGPEEEPRPQRRRAVGMVTKTTFRYLIGNTGGFGGQASHNVGRMSGVRYWD